MRNATTLVTLAIVLTGLTWLRPASAESGGLQVRVLDRDGKAIPEVAVYAVPDRPRAASSAPTAARMDQRGRAFMPHILVVETGTVVEFPNSDDVLHHVYSFSKAKKFELPLYGNAPVSPEIRFGEPGLVTLGCNIHDEMLAYILIVDTPHFGKTDASGRTNLSALPAGGYRVHVWTPRLRSDDLPPPIEIRVAGDAPESVAVRIEHKLRPPHSHSETSLLWSRY